MSSATHTLPVSGMTCASCAGRVERALLKVPGVASASVNRQRAGARRKQRGGPRGPDRSRAEGRLWRAGAESGAGHRRHDLRQLRWPRRACLLKVPVRSAAVNLASERAHVEVLGPPDPAALIRAVEAAGYHATASSERRPAADAERRLQRERWAVIAGLLLAAPLVLPMFGELFGQHWMLPAWIQFLLATPVQFVLGARFYVAGWKAVRAGAGNMDLLVAIGTSAGYGLSLYQWWATPAGQMPHLYFEASAVVIALVLLGKYRKPRQAPDQRGDPGTGSLASGPRDTGDRRPRGRRRHRRAAPGRLVLVKPGERFPVDGEVVEGESRPTKR